MVEGTTYMSKETPVKNYRKPATTSVIPPIVTGAINTSSGSGKNTQITSDSYSRSAKMFGFNAGMLFDITAPHLNVNSQHILFQSKNINLKTFNNQTSCINNWVRAQNLNANQSAYTYIYSEQEHKTAAPLFLQQNSKAYYYYDHLKIQVGQLSKLPVASVPLDNRYGCIDIGSINNISFESKEGYINFKSALPITLSSDSLIKMAAAGISLTSTVGGLIKAEGELAFSTTGPMLFASDSALALNTTSVMYLDAAVVVIGSSGYYKGLVDLDSSVINAVTESVGFDSISSLSSVTSALSSQVTSALGAFTPGNIQETINSATDLDSLTGNVFSNTVTNKLLSDGYSDFINNIIPTNSLTTLLPILSGSFTFNTYPEIVSIEPYTSANLDKSSRSTSVGGISIPPLSVKEE